MDLGLQGGKAIVTGASRGIGRRIAELLADEGCDIALCARADSRVADAAESLEKRGVRAFGSALNVRDGARYVQWLSEAREALSGVDIFIANVSAGGGMDGNDSERDWYRNFEIDVLAAVRGCELLADAMKDSNRAAIVMIGEALSGEAFGPPLAYNALKSALATYAKQLSHALAPSGIRVNAVAPGPTQFEGSRWEMLEHADPRLYKAVVRQHPSRRLSEADEIARYAVFLASPAASWVNGTQIPVDGGFSQRIGF